ncbi:MAG: hypothetical protein AVDCRST_MAG76-1439 [uncultured Acidimicrobiales bacterium]|uniref:Uncharacterized protein n=1 Tax=uncultured Acidimicrobiales bacterium TaxID=310071 RepID=A0A6J4HV02_9ACTN|nr:MAG: hypothetical protein AVDCRST_MAG76-1439 [uncultured Acidimicrobiales bacterium]
MLNVPPGYYAVTGAATVFNIDSDPQFFDCAINDGNRFGGRLDGVRSMTIPVLGTFTGPGTIRMTCAGFRMQMTTSSALQAIKVG